jgi:hypothetical protein
MTERDPTTNFEVLTRFDLIGSQMGHIRANQSHEMKHQTFMEDAQRRQSDILLTVNRIPPRPQRANKDLRWNHDRSQGTRTNFYASEQLHEGSILADRHTRSVDTRMNRGAHVRYYDEHDYKRYRGGDPVDPFTKMVAAHNNELVVPNLEPYN